MRWRSRRLGSTLVLAIMLSGLGGALVAQEPASALEEARRELVGLRFEKALAVLATYLEREDLSEAQRSEGLILRAQAHVASGNWTAVERDYRGILALRPEFRPDPKVTPRRAQQVFDRIQAATVGTVRLELDPADATVRVDGREVERDEAGAITVLAGDRILRAERRGFDPAETSLSVAPGKEAQASLKLVPNARTVVVRTEPEGVAVHLDGVPVGETRRPEGLDPATGLPRAAELVLEHLAPGEHRFDLIKPCYRTERMRDLITVDLMDRDPKVYRTVTLAPARSRLVLEGGPEGAEVLVDGAPAGTLPVAPILLCPGRPIVEARAGGRTLWWHRAEVGDQEEARLLVEPRPNAALYGAEAWPEELRALGDALSVRVADGTLSDRDLTRPEGWQSLVFPPDTDLALAVLPAPARGASPTFYLYSPVLRRVERIEAPAVRAGRPDWLVPAAGWRLADSRVGGAARVVEVRPGGAAASAGILPGDRIAILDGAPAGNAAEVLSALRAAGHGRSVTLGVESLDGTRREVTLTPSSSPRLYSPADRPASAALMGAWAMVDGTLGGPASAPALANLALLYAEASAPAQAEAAWRRARWPGRRGVGEGTVAYYRARSLAVLGREREAEALFRTAASSEATAFHDDGPGVALAAVDHLADLGVASPNSSGATAP
jgi:hypothetical protein